MKQQTALVFLLLFSYVQIDYFVGIATSDTESSVSLSVVDRFFRTPKGQVCANGEKNFNISECSNSSLVDVNTDGITDVITDGITDVTTRIALTEEQVTTDLYR